MGRYEHLYERYLRQSYHPAVAAVEAAKALRLETRKTMRRQELEIQGQGWILQDRKNIQGGEVSETS